MESVGFKEWAIVCEALGRGEQSIILRKGASRKASDGFSFRHAEFFLFPTYFHEQLENIWETSVAIPEPNEYQVPLRFFAKVEHALTIESWTGTAALAPFYILGESVVRERFEDKRAVGIHVVFVRVFRVPAGMGFA